MVPARPKYISGKLRSFSKNFSIFFFIPHFLKIFCPRMQVSLMQKNSLPRGWKHPKIAHHPKIDFFKVWKELEIFFSYNMSSSEKNVSNLKVFFFLVFFKKFFFERSELEKKVLKSKNDFLFSKPKHLFFRKRGAPERNGSRRREWSGGAPRFRKQKVLGFWK